MLQRYLESFQSKQSPQHRPKLVEEALVRLSSGDVAGSHRALLRLRQAAPAVARDLEGPLKCVNDFDCPRGRASLQRAISVDGVDIPADTDPVTAGMTLLLDYPERFDETLAIYHVEQTDNWCLYRGPEPRTVKVTAELARALARDFSKMLKEIGLTGKCVPYVFEQEERVIIELSHDQYVEALRQFRGSDIEVDWTRPVRNARLVYRPSTGVIKVRVCRNEPRLVKALLRAVGSRLFGWEGHFLGAGARLNLHLAGLSAQPALVTDPADQIGRVEVVCLEFTRSGDPRTVARFHGSRTEHLYDLVRLFCPNTTRVQEKALLCGSQTGKTTVALADVCHFCDTHSVRVIYTMHTADAVRAFSRTRAKPAIQSSPYLSQRIRSITAASR